MRTWTSSIARGGVTLTLTWLLCSCATPVHPQVPTLHPIILSTRPHDPAAFTEGLDIEGNLLYEGTGMPGHSVVRVADLGTGAVHAEASLPSPLFGEGVAVVDAAGQSTLWQLTWRDQMAIERDPVTLAERRRVAFGGEGWGLCARRGQLVMSNGTNALTVRDPATFAPLRTIRLAGWEDVQLNSLACAADGSVYANEWPTDRILRIDPDTAKATAEIDASALRPVPLNVNVGNVLNGIAQLPDGTFLVTGKYWPTAFIVRFVQA